MSSTTTRPATTPATLRLPLPPERGPLSGAVVAFLRTGGRDVDGDAFLALADTAAAVDVLADEDVQLALFLLYELHHQGIADVDDDLEWNPLLLGFRARLERPLEQALRALVETTSVAPEDVPAALFALAADGSGPSLAAHLARRGTLEQYREFLVRRSIYHLREADPHTWAIPRLAGRAKAALVEIQADEYGGGRADRMHSTLFAGTMRALGLDDAYGTHLARVPASTLATVNAMSFFGLHRRLRGAVVGHLAVFEMTSSLPNRSYGDGLRRLGHGRDATWFFDEHVEADAVHEQIAGHDLAGGLVAAEPDLVDDVLFGARASIALDDLVATEVLAAWEAGRSSLLPGGEDVVAGHAPAAS